MTIPTPRLNGFPGFCLPNFRLSVVARVFGVLIVVIEILLLRVLVSERERDPIAPSSLPRSHSRAGLGEP